MSSQVHLFRYNDAGAPRLSGTAGDLIGLLDACLVSGYGTKTLDSLTFSNGVAVATCNAGHGFKAFQVLRIGGANQTEYNGDWPLLDVLSANQFTFVITGSPASPATGTITAKIAPMDWTKAFSGTNLAAYKIPVNIDGLTTTGFYLRVDDTAAQYALARGYEAMTDVSTGTGQFPTGSQLHPYWRKSSISDTTARIWALIGDGAFFWFFPGWNAADGTLSETNFFGDLISYKAGDAYGCTVTGSSVTNQTSAGMYHTAMTLFNSGGGGPYVARSYTQIGSAVRHLTCAYPADLASKTGTTPNVIGSANMGSNFLVYPNAADSALHLRGPVDLAEGNTGSSPTGSLRGSLPGAYAPIQMGPLDWWDTVSNIAGLPGRTIMMFYVAGHPSNVATAGRLAIDITGPWR